MNPAFVEKVIEHDDVHRFKELLGSKGGVLSVPHTGSWDLGAVGASLFGISMFYITRRQKNLLVDNYLNSMRTITGIGVLYRDSPSMLKGVLGNLKKGLVLAIMPDVRMPTPAYSINFLGGQANLGGGSAMFARQAKVPLFPAALTRIGWARHQWQLLEPIYPNPKIEKNEDAQRMMQDMLSQFEEIVRSEPEQYFWYNKRWVLQPLSEDSD